jgi:hypothetical protein
LDQGISPGEARERLLADLATLYPLTAGDRGVWWDVVFGIGRFVVVAALALWGMWHSWHNLAPPAIVVAAIGYYLGQPWVKVYLHKRAAAVFAAQRAEHLRSLERQLRALPDLEITMRLAAVAQRTHAGHVTGLIHTVEALAAMPGDAPLPALSAPSPSTHQPPGKVGQHVP